MHPPISPTYMLGYKDKLDSLQVNLQLLKPDIERRDIALNTTSMLVAIFFYCLNYQHMIVRAGTGLPRKFKIEGVD